MKRFVLFLFVAFACTGSAFAQFRADTVSPLRSTPAPRFGIAGENSGALYGDARNQAPPAIATATNSLHQGTDSITITYTPSAVLPFGPNPLATETNLTLFVGLRTFPAGTTAANITQAQVIQAANAGVLQWGGSRIATPGGDWGADFNAAMALQRVGNNWQTTFSMRRLFPANTQIIARLLVLVRAVSGMRPCSDPLGCQQTDNREFTFAPTNLATSIRRSDEFVDTFSASPNPTANDSYIQFNMKKAGNVTVKIYNTLGQEVRTVLNGQRFGQGMSTVEWNGSDNAGNRVNSGMYIYRIEVDGTIQSGHIAVAR